MNSSWFESSAKTERLLAEERLILDAMEKMSEALECAGMKRADLAKALDVSKNEISQRMSGQRNLTLRTLAAMLFAVGAEARISVRPFLPSTESPQADEVMVKRMQSRSRSSYRQAPPDYREFHEVIVGAL